MRALVTGAGGFIGGHLVTSLLLDGYDVTAVDVKPLEAWHQIWPGAPVNLTSARVRQLGKRLIETADEVYHLAADMGGIGFTSQNRVSCATNIVDTVHLLEHCSAGQRVFYASTACVYPVWRQVDHHVVASLKETDVWPYDPDGAYGFEKLYGEQLLRWFATERGIVPRVARYHNVYGSHGDWDGGREKAPAALCRKVATAVVTGDHSIEIWGDGQQLRSFMHVEDCVTGTRLIMGSNYSEPLNLGSNEWVSINQLVSLLEEIAGVKLRRHYNPDAPQGVRSRNSDNTLIQQVLGWAPSLPLQAGLELTYAWIYDQVRQRHESKAVAG